jgi:hypothetical protein
VLNSTLSTYISLEICFSTLSIITTAFSEGDTSCRFEGESFLPELLLFFLKLKQSSSSSSSRRLDGAGLTSFLSL